MSRLTKSTPPREPGPPWEIATIFPNQGQWSEADYLLAAVFEAGKTAGG